MPRLTHPDAPEPFETDSKDLADVFRANGWVNEKKAPEKSPKKKTPKKSAPAPVAATSNPDGPRADRY